MDDVGSRDLAFYRLQSAWERLIVADQAARAVLATLGLDSRKHSGVISLFNLNFVKSGVFPKEFRKIIASSQDLRLASDYDDFYLASKQDAEKTIANAREFISGVENFLKSHYSA